MSPAVNLALEDVPFAILEVVKARILANRRRLGVGQGEQKPPPSLKPRPQLRKFGASSKNYRRPEPAATGGGSAYHSIFWYAYDDPGGAAPIRVKLFSGDATSSEEISFSTVSEDPFPGSQNRFGYSNYLIDFSLLPIDKDSLVVVLSFASLTGDVNFKMQDPPFQDQFVSPPRYIAIGSRHTSSQHAFFVSKTTVKPISLPSDLRNKVAATFYLPSGEYASLLAARASFEFPHVYSYSYWFSRAKFMDINAGLEFDDFTPYYNYISSFHSPGSYALFNNFTTANSLGNSLTANNSLPSDKKLWQMDAIYNFLGNAGAPYPKNTLAISQLDPTLATALTYRGPYPPSVESGDPSYPPVEGIEDPAWRKAGKNPSVAKRPTDPYSSNPLEPTVYQVFFWDWGKPSYCREQLLALGFTEANLQP